MSDASPKLGYVWVAAMLAVLIFVFYQALNAPFPFPFLALMSTFSFIYWQYVVWWGAYNPEYGLHKGKMFQFSSGVCGTVLGIPKRVTGGKMKFRVSIPNYYVPRGQRKGGWIRGVGEVATGTHTVEVIDYPTLFKEIPAEACECPEGAIKYYGRVDGGKLDDDITELLEKLRAAGQRESQIFEISRQAELQARNLGKQKLHDLRSVSEYGREVADNFKRINVIVSGRGGASGYSAVADD